MNSIQNIVGQTDNYLLDLILKGHYHQDEVILDAGCGLGRNLHWFYHNDFKLYGIDLDEERIDACKDQYPKIADQLSLASLDELPFEDEQFDHIICSAVLHFASSKEHFMQMLSEMSRTLKTNGSIFIRTCTDKGIKEHISYLGQGRYLLGDESERFLVTDNLLEEVLSTLPLTLAASYKSVVVNYERSMGVLLLRKTA